MAITGFTHKKIASSSSLSYLNRRAVLLCIILMSLAISAIAGNEREFETPVLDNVNIHNGEFQSIKLNTPPRIRNIVTF